MDIKSLRSKLAERRGQWTRIAVVAGLSRKTIQRLMDDPDYNPTLHTCTQIEQAIRVIRPTARESV